MQVHSPATNAGAPTVLLADFERVTRTKLEHELRRVGIEVVSVEHPSAVVEAIVKRRVALAIVDLRDGADLIERIRRWCATARIVGITSRPSTAITTRAMRLGALDVYVKPVHPTWITKWIDPSLARGLAETTAPPPLLRLDVPTYEADALPPELASIPAIKPGSRAAA